MNANYFVKLENFEGPLDLLLHLVKVHEIDIFDIDIFFLASEYLNYLRLVKFDDLAQAGEFIEMAATMVEIKTRMLLPHDEKKSRDEDLDEEDPVKLLQERLLQYEMFKQVAEHLNAMPQMGVEIQTNAEWQRLEPEYEHIERPLSGEPSTLLILYEQMLRDLSERREGKVKTMRERLKLEDVIEKMHQEIEQVRFALFQGYYNLFQSRDELVIHIMAVLELTRAFRMKVYQQELLGPLWMYRYDLDESVIPSNRMNPAQEAIDYALEGAGIDYSDGPQATETET